ncbi:MAG: hypothetical protein K6U87_07515, partial [Firmicutes bacterium]|nr:hypothetical protein [Bacillota bacterium]
WVASPQQAAVPISPPAVAVSSAVWNPAGTALAYGGGIKPSGGLARGVLLVVDPSGREVGPSLSATNAQYLLVRWLPTGILFWQDPYFSMSVAADGLTLYTWREGGGEAPKALAVTLPYASWVAPSADGTAVALVAGKGRETWLNKSVNLCTLPDGHCQRLGPSSNAAVALDPAVGPEGALWVEANRRSGGGWSSCSTPASCQNQGAQEAQAALQLQRWLQSRVLWWKPPGQVAREVAAAGSGIYDPEWAKGKPETILVKDGSLWLIDLSQGKLERLTGPLGGSGSPPAYGYYGHVGWDKLWAWYR